MMCSKTERRMKHAATMILVAVAMVGCRSTQADPDLAPTPKAVFAVGAIPHYNNPTGLGADQGMCTIAFAPGPITKPGRFEAGCEGRGTSTFEAAVPTRLEVEVTSTKLAAGETRDTLRAPFPVALADPDSLGLGLRAVTFAADGRRLDGGFSRATWTPDPGCAKLVTFRDLDLPDMNVYPVALGTCTLEVSYLGLKTTTSVVVR